jgi:hypothetical protein
MPVIPVVLSGGLDLVRSKQEAAPGSLSECKNFEVGNTRGYTEIQGIRSYSAGVANDVIDPYVFYSSGDFIEIITVTGSDASFTEGTVISWGEGGTYDVIAQSLTEVDGTATICYSVLNPDNNTLFAVVNIKGRMPAPGDIITTPGGGIAEVINPPPLASEMVADGRAELFALAGQPDDTVDKISGLIRSFDLDANATHAWPIPASPMGSAMGGFLFNDRVHAIMDIETWTFTSGSAEPSVGDFFQLFYSGVIGVGSSYTYTVENVITESGDWSAGTAAGKIELVLNITSGQLSSAKNVFDCRNSTTATNDPMTIGGLTRSSKAMMMREAVIASGITAEPYERVDLGYECRFSAGDNFFTVLNRANRDAQLESVVTTTDWLTFGTATGWTNSSNATDGTVGTFATQPNDSVLRPPLVCTNALIDLPSTAVVLGVEIEVTRRKQASGFISARDRSVTLVGVPSYQDKKKAEFWPTVSTATTYGSASDLWGTSLSASILNDSGFGVAIAAEAVNGAGGNDREIDSVRVRITYKDRSSFVYFGDAATTAITSITRVTTTATVTTTAAHGFTTGQSVTISGAVQTEYNGTYVITVTGLTTFTYTVAGAPATPATGTITAFRNFSTARVIWYNKEKGDWSTNDAQGTLTLYEVSNPTAIRVGQLIRNSAGTGGTTYATVASACEKVYLPSSNALETNASQWEITDPVNFYGAVGTEQVLMASGADFGATFDGTYYIRVRTGVETSQDKPRHVVKHLDQAIWGYVQGVSIASDLGYPESTAGVVGGTLGGSSPISDDTSTYPTFAGGAQQILHGDSVYGYIALSQQSMGVMCRNSIQQLVGSGGALVANLISGESGIIEYTLRNVGQPIFCDYRGIGTVTATAAFGDFARGRMSDAVSPFLIPRLQQYGASTLSTTGPIRAEVIRNKNQYRVYFRDRTCLTMTMVGNAFDNPQFTIQVLPFVPACTFTGVTSGGKDLLFLIPYGMAEFGAFSNDLKDAYEDDSNYVPNFNLYAPAFIYQGDVGTSWDGLLPIDSYIVVNGGASGREWEVKHYDRMIVGGQCFGFAPFAANFGVDFGDIETGTPVSINAGSTSGTGIKAFTKQTFSVTQDIKRDGFALSVKFVNDGTTVYGATTEQVSPYAFRPVTLQSIILITEQEKTRR